MPFPTAKRKRLLWTAEEENMLKVHVFGHSAPACLELCSIIMYIFPVFFPNNRKHQESILINSVWYRNTCLEI